MTDSNHHQARSWTILLVKEGPGLVGDDIRVALERATYRMRLDGWAATRFKAPTCEGYVEDAEKACSIAAVRGMLFKAQVDHDEGSFRINFLINESDLARGAQRLEELERDEPMRCVVTPDYGTLPRPLYEFLAAPSGALQ